MQLKEQCNLDLSPWLDQFRNPSLVKHFYCNMSMANVVDKKGKLVRNECITSVRGKHITIYADIINSPLFIENPPPMPHIKYDKERFFKILRPGERYVGELKFSPVDMPPIHRVL